MARRETWHIFCTVVDNFGDIGVTWRLARQLIREQGRSVTLWVDDLESFSRIEPAIDPSKTYQQVGGANIRRWHSAFPDVEPADVVIEAFACHLPEKYVMRMAKQTPRAAWINLEYLCAEKWIEESHMLPSPHPHLPLTKYFFFPGFTAKTGGLLRERDVIARRDALWADAKAQRDFWASIDVPADTGDAVRVSLFGYKNSGLASLLDAWVGGPNPVLCLLPESPLAQDAQAHLGSTSRRLERGQLAIHILPFMPQDDYDTLLALCDINFVRGEDSFLRAQWAGKPFIWHIYPQADEAHLPKLEAFLDLYTAHLDPASTARVKYAWHHWNLGQDMRAPWRDFAAGRGVLEPYGADWASRLAASPSLAEKLADFVDKLL
ncbi:MAG: elongation factor P maturation arginine rhamnosyltransferase EarP [Betaproteobacteria bacterium]|nr:elongation factor P maturation arginine rhamnosyltransferase EarP [Betaproteobacteria bacterium]